MTGSGLPRLQGSGRSTVCVTGDWRNRIWAAYNGTCTQLLGDIWQMVWQEHTVLHYSFAQACLYLWLCIISFSDANLHICKYSLTVRQMSILYCKTFPFCYVFVFLVFVFQYLMTAIQRNIKRLFLHSSGNLSVIYWYHICVIGKCSFPLFLHYD